MKYGVIYYSFSGNTEQIAERIKVAKQADIERIETVKPYPRDFDALLEQGKAEIESKFLPEIKPSHLDLSSYDKLIIGTPTWWYSATPAIFSFLKQHDFHGKDVAFFQTHGGEPGNAIKDMEAVCPGAKFSDSMAIYFDYYHKNRLLTDIQEIDRWIASL